MESIWNTIGTIIATGLVIYGGHLITDYLQSRREDKKQKIARQRETREAVRRYRESVTTPVKQELNTVQAILSKRAYFNVIVNAEKEGVSLTPDSKADIEVLKELLKKQDVKDMEVIFTKVMPVVAAITDEETRKAVSLAIVGPCLTEDIRKLLNIVDLNEAIRTAYKKLENYVALAD